MTTATGQTSLMTTLIDSPDVQRRGVAADGSLFEPYRWRVWTARRRYVPVGEASHPGPRSLLRSRRRVQLESVREDVLGGRFFN